MRAVILASFMVPTAPAVTASEAITVVGDDTIYPGDRKIRIIGLRSLPKRTSATMAENTGFSWVDHAWSLWIGCKKVSP